MIRRTNQERLTVLPPEGQKGVQQPFRVETAVGVQPGQRDVGQGVLGTTGQGARQDFAVDRIGDHQSAGSVTTQQAQVY